MEKNCFGEIHWPDAGERELQITQITARAMLKPRHLGSALWSLFGAVGLRGVCFGVWDGMLLALLLDGALWAVVYEAAKNSPQLLGLLVFLASPVLYALLHLLTVWKEKTAGMYQTLMVCRLSLHQMTVLRLLLSAGASALLLCGVNVWADFCVWEEASALRLLVLSFTALFFYAWMQLLMEWKWRKRMAIGVVPVSWCCLGAVLLLAGDRIAAWETPPTALLLLCMAVCAVLYARLLKKYYFEAGVLDIAD